MATTADEFREILNADGTIDMNRLRDVSRHGVAAEVRGDVWKYLLGVSKPDKSQAATDRRKMAEEYHDLVKSSESLHQIKNDILRYTRRQSDLSVPNLREKAERVLSSFFNFKNSTIPYHSGIVSMTIAFFACVSEESDVYFCLKNLVRKIEDKFQGDHIRVDVANFMMLFRSLIPDLYNHFEEEEIHPKEWVISWIRFLLAKELPLSTECLLRLWDSYFSCETPFEIHVYICLAVLEACREELLERDQSDIMLFLQRLPELDMDQIITRAYNIQWMVHERGLM
eukprot:TRINITY_DN7045_c0_g1_i1.p1 TRINITY_DN7045_c0_g1~~TRINITY_DN7045_c0_g1_i1.p1  ORF type:complete len:284 (+),score=45.29 TRINITY_DN7045_c0_g1_i1:43-894(+)